MKLFGKYIGVTALLTAALLMSSRASLAASTSEQYALCKEAVKSLYGERARVKMFGTRSYKGVLTLKLKVTPEAGSSVILQCSEQEDTEERVVLKDKEGKVLAA
jgi:hypothetical protein